MDILRILLCHVIQKFALQYKMSYFKNIRQLFETIVRENFAFSFQHIL